MQELKSSKSFEKTITGFALICKTCLFKKVMKGAMIGKCLIGMLIVLSTPQWIMARAGHSGNPITSEITVISPQTDTVPPSKKIPAAPGNKPVSDDKPVAKVIKVVPKARRQTVPVRVDVKIKPVKVIKPKIIKPVIRVLH